MRDKIVRLAELISESNKIVVFTGAGISVESGIPDFRGPNGLWRKYDPRVASIDYFMNNPEGFWKFALDVAETLRNARPNPAHIAIAKLEELGKVHCVITQNIDGLHQRAGSKNVIEVHGNAYEASCISCGAPYKTEEILRKAAKGIPKCSFCGGLIKPNIVLFGERLPWGALFDAYKCAEKCDLMLIVGSSLVVYPAAEIPMKALKRGAKIAIVNLEPTPLDDYASVIVHGKAGEILPKVVDTTLKIIGRGK